MPRDRKNTQQICPRNDGSLSYQNTETIPVIWW
jgi:hypothetical protein